MARKEMPEKVRNYKLFSELSYNAQEKAEKETKKYNFQDTRKPGEFLWKEDGSPACMTVEERKRWYI